MGREMGGEEVESLLRVLSLINVVCGMLSLLGVVCRTFWVTRPMIWSGEE